jgi:hypothetical protein
MKTIRIIPLLLIAVLSSCASVSVNQDYNRQIDFTQFKTYAFYKAGIDKADISDLDKKRILHAIEAEMSAKGFTKSEKPDLLVNIFTKSQQYIDVNQYNSYWGYGWGYGWSPWAGRTTVTSSTEGTLFIDLIDAKKKELVWEGEGTGELTKNVDKKDEVIKNFVAKILAQYPPKIKK